MYIVNLYFIHCINTDIMLYVSNYKTWTNKWWRIAILNKVRRITVCCKLFHFWFARGSALFPAFPIIFQCVIALWRSEIIDRKTEFMLPLCQNGWSFICIPSDSQFENGNRSWRQLLCTEVCRWVRTELTRGTIREKGGKSGELNKGMVFESLVAPTR